MSHCFIVFVVIRLIKGPIIHIKMSDNSKCIHFHHNKPLKTPAAALRCPFESDSIKDSRRHMNIRGSFDTHSDLF